MKTFTVGWWAPPFRGLVGLPLRALLAGALLLVPPILPRATGQDAAKEAPGSTDPAKEKPSKEAPAAASKDPGPAVGPPAPDVPGEASPGLPDGVLARLNGRDIRVDEYASYLLASLGRSKLDEYIDRLLVEEEAKRLEVTVAPEAVEASVTERIDRIVKSVYKGQEEGYLANLARRRSSLEEEKAKLRQERYYDLLRDQVILKTRQVTEEDIQRKFEELHGEGGVRYTLRHILIAARPGGAQVPPRLSPDQPPRLSPDQPPRPLPEQPPRDGEQGAKAGPRTRAEARARAETVLKELQAGGDFAQAVKQYSDDALTKRNDGRIPVYRKEYLGEDFHRAVSQLGPESPLSGIVESPRGFHIIQLVEKKLTRLEDVRAELEKAVKEAAPTPKERLELVEKLRSGAKIEGLQ